MSSKRIEDITAQLLAGKPLPSTTEYHRRCNDIMREYITARDGSDGRSFAKAMKLKPQIKTAVLVMHYHGMNPKEVPAEDLRYAIQHPLDEQTFIGPEIRKRVDGPIKGIRAFCLNCQGNDNAGVRECAAVNCPLWAFRMGHNPYYGRLAAGEAELTDAEVEAEAEEAELEEERDANTQA